MNWALDFTLGFYGARDRDKADVVERLGLAPLLLADEPFDGLDLRQTREVSAALRAYAAAGRTLFLSIHQISDAARVCDRFVLLSGGRVCAEGTIAELAHRVNAPQTPNLEELFLALT